MNTGDSRITETIVIYKYLRPQRGIQYVPKLDR